MAIGAPVALAVAAAAPGLWILAAAWVLAVGGLMLADALLAPPARALSLQVSAPRVLGAGRSASAQVRARFERPGPGDLELAVDMNDRLTVSPCAQSSAGHRQ